MVICDLCKDLKRRTTQFHIVLRANSTLKKPDRDVISVDVALCSKCVSSFCSRLHHFVFDIRKQEEDPDPTKEDLGRIQSRTNLMIVCDICMRPNNVKEISIKLDQTNDNESIENIDEFNHDLCEDCLAGLRDKIIGFISQEYEFYSKLKQ